MTKIAWTDESWNPVVGCTKVSEGCLNCYAEKMARRQAYMGNQKYQRVVESEEDERNGENVVNAPKVSFYGWNGETYCDESALNKPLHWRKPRRIFVVSMGDLFHEKVPFEFIDKVFATIALCPQHIFQCLTKRPKRMTEWFESMEWGLHKPIPNLWLGVSVENQKCADERIPILLQIPAAVRFVSVEPMLERVDLWRTSWINKKTPSGFSYSRNPHWLKEIHQVIIGCESGPKRRECKLEWVRDLVRQCKAAGVAVFVKQLSINGKVEHDINKFPEDLRLREYPK